MHQAESNDSQMSIFLDEVYVPWVELLVNGLASDKNAQWSADVNESQFAVDSGTTVFSHRKSIASYGGSAEPSY